MLCINPLCFFLDLSTLRHHFMHPHFLLITLEKHGGCKLPCFFRFSNQGLLVGDSGFEKSKYAHWSKGGKKIMLVKIWKGFYALWGCSTIRDIRNIKTLVRVSGEVFVRRESTVRVAPNYWKEVGGDEHWLLTVVSLLMTQMWSFAMESKHQPRFLWFEVPLIIWRVPFPLLNKFIITGCCQHPSFSLKWRPLSLLAVAIQTRLELFW